MNVNVRHLRRCKRHHESKKPRHLSLSKDMNDRPCVEKLVTSTLSISELNFSNDTKSGAKSAKKIAQRFESNRVECTSKTTLHRMRKALTIEMGLQLGSCPQALPRPSKRQLCFPNKRGDRRKEVAVSRLWLEEFSSKALKRILFVP